MVSPQWLRGASVAITVTGKHNIFNWYLGLTQRLRVHSLFPRRFCFLLLRSLRKNVERRHDVFNGHGVWNDFTIFHQILIKTRIVQLGLLEQMLPKLSQSWAPKTHQLLVASSNHTMQQKCQEITAFKMHFSTLYLLLNIFLRSQFQHISNVLLLLTTSEVFLFLFLFQQQCLVQRDFSLLAPPGVIPSLKTTELNDIPCRASVQLKRCTVAKRQKPVGLFKKCVCRFNA